MPHDPAFTLNDAPARNRRRYWITGYLSLFALAAMLVAVVANAADAAARRRAAERAYVHTLDVLIATGELATAVNAALRGERGYLLTHDPRFLQPYEKARRDIPRMTDRLAALTRDNPRQRANLAALRVRMRSYLDLLALSVDLERSGRTAEARRIVRAGLGRSRIEGVLGVVADAEAEEHRLLRIRRAATDAANARADRYAVRLAALGALLLLVAGCAGFFSLRAHRRLQDASAELRRIATVDELTGLANRRAFMGALQTEIARARRGGEPLVLAILDIDHFKRVNDRHGHPAGDAVLAAAAAKMLGCIRAGDVVGRIGGEEFAILMPVTDLDGARLVCERLRAAIEARPVDVAGAIGVLVTVSTGIALLRYGERCDSLILRADAALYEAKTSGRNQVRLAA